MFTRDERKYYSNQPSSAKANYSTFLFRYSSVGIHWKRLALKFTSLTRWLAVVLSLRHRPTLQNILYCSTLDDRTSIILGHQLRMPFRSATGSRVLGRGFPPPLNPAVENTTCTLCTDADSIESWDLAHRTIAVKSAIKTYIYIHTSSIIWCGSKI